MGDVNFQFDKEPEVKIDFESDDEPKFEQKKLKIKKGGLKIKKGPRPPPRAPQQSMPDFTDKTFEMFSNPEKKMPEMSDDDNEDDGDDEESEALSENFDEDGIEGGHNENHVEPSAGYATIEEEKQDLLYKFHRLESKGVKFSKKFNAYSDIREMRAEFNKFKKDAEATQSVKFSKKMLMAFVSGVEFLNKRYDPVGAELDGWSENVMENVNDGDYDNVFERLHEKYGGRVDTPPEIELMMSLGGSAIMFHMSSKMFKNLPDVGNMAKKNPEMMANLMKTVNETLNTQQMRQNGNAPMAPPMRDEELPPQEGMRREMMGPSVNLSQFSNFMPPPMMSGMGGMNNVEPIFSETSDESNISVKKVAISEGGTRRGRKPKISQTSENTINL